MRGQKKLDAAVVGGHHCTVLADWASLGGENPSWGHRSNSVHLLGLTVQVGQVPACISPHRQTLYTMLFEQKHRASDDVESSAFSGILMNIRGNAVPVIMILIGLLGMIFILYAIGWLQSERVVLLVQGVTRSCFIPVLKESLLLGVFGAFRHHIWY